jgi:hypothetical protein
MHEVSPKVPFYATMLRDPVQRYLSHYRYLIDCGRDPNSRLHEFAVQKLQDGKRIRSLEEFVERGELCNVMTHYLAGAMHPDRQSGRWYVTDAGELLELATALLEKVDFVGLVEHMPQDLQLICRQAGVKPVSGVVNASRASLASPPDADLLQRIRALNSLDEEIYQRARQIREEQLARLES